MPRVLALVKDRGAIRRPAGPGVAGRWIAQWAPGEVSPYGLKPCCSQEPRGLPVDVSATSRNHVRVCGLGPTGSFRAANSRPRMSAPGRQGEFVAVNSGHWPGPDGAQ